MIPVRRACGHVMAGPKRRVGWIGLGAIGLPMAVRAATLGWEVHAYDSVAARCDAARAAGI